MTNHRLHRFGLSKSKITAFEQCSRRLWQQVHAPGRAELDEGAEARFAAGHEVGALACALYPQGVMVEAEPNLSAAVAETLRLLEEGHPGPIFEATFEHDGVLVRVDILARNGNGWRMFEVKSSTGAKDYHRGDLATQVWVAREAGIEVTGAAIRHLDNGFVLEREGDYDGLFADAELMAEIEGTVSARPSVVEQAREVLAGPEPEIMPGDHCSKPFSCEFAGWCNRDMPAGPEWPVTILPNGGGRKWLEQGIEDLLDLDERELSQRNARIVAATRSGTPYHDVAGARTAMAEWGWPRAWLDFETIAFAVPRWIGTRPYQQVPFQFSLHLESKDGRIEHHESLDMTGADPRTACAEALVRSIPEGATIVAYNAQFERRVLNELARDCPKRAKALLAMAERTVDLLPVARNHWYHHDQRGSWSIKAVLPTIGEAGYSGLEVKDGGDAQAAYLEAIDPATTPERRSAIEDGLKAYCMRDTSAMIAVARVLVGKAQSV